MMVDFFLNRTAVVVWLMTAVSVDVLAQVVPSATALTATNRLGARIQFAASIHDFGKIASGSSFKHEYIFTNTGNAKLEVSEVRTSCGCAVAGDWTREVAPGQTGMIPIELNTTNLSGPLLKAVSVSCNDSNQPQVMLQLKATIWKPIEVVPQLVVFSLSADTVTNQTKAVRITNFTGQPLTLSAAESSHKSITAEVKTISPGKEFELLITAVPPFSGTSIQAPVTVKTSSTNMSVIRVNTIAIIQPVVAIMPNQITLPSAPLPAPTQAGVTIRFNGPSARSLSQPTANFLTTRTEAGKSLERAQPIPGVTVRMQELQPGRFYNVMVSFPAGLEIRPGQKAELSIKTSDPKSPSLKIPIQQKASTLPAAANAPSPTSGSAK